MREQSALARFMEARSAIAARASSPSTLPGPTGLDLCHYLTDLLDEALVELAGNHLGIARGDSASVPGDALQRGWALVAVGGYGRRELARHSDVDVMLLLSGDHDAEHLVRMLYPLWDANLKVGHSVRTVAQVAEAARANVETATSILDARLLAGDEALYAAFERERRSVVRKLRPWLREELAARHADLARRQPWQLLAVDLKNGRGGLRGLHMIHWLAAAEAIAGDGEESPVSEELEAARDVLLRTRHAVHAVTSRPTDFYRPETAAEASRWLDVDPFDWSWRLYQQMRVVDAAATEALRAPAQRSRWPWGRRPAEVAPDDPSNLANLRRALREVAPGGPLDPLVPEPWLERLLPEWSLLRARPHVAPFHIHPVDVHAMRTVVEARTVMEQDEFDAGTPEVARALGRPDEVLLAAMLHDIGKGRAGVEHPEAGAVMAERFAARAGLPAQEAVRLVAALRHHLLLPAVATRRDIADPAVIRETAETVGDLATLRLLYLLSIADARASGPNVWNQWKAQLMRSLYQRVGAALAVEAAGTVAGTASVEAAVEALAGRFPAEAVREHLRGLEPGYLVSTTPSAIGDHLALIEEALEHGGAAARRDQLGSIDRLTLVCPDRPGLLQDIAGTMAGFSVNLLGGVAYTRADGIAIEVWHVADALGVGIDDRRWERILAAIPSAARGEYDIQDRLAEVRRSYPQAPRREDIETKVHVDNRASRDYSVLEISAPDRRGLLYAVTAALHDLRIDIHLAKVDTIGPEVFDAFYIQRENGSRIEEADEVHRLERRVEEVLAALD
jgi:[protein-PII] uridylyltransferase